MKKSIFAICLLGAGSVFGQTVNSSSTTTTTTTIDSTNRANNSTYSTSPTTTTPMNNGTTGTYNNQTGTSNNSSTMDNNSMNRSGSMNNSYNSTTTTTTTTNTDYNKGGSTYSGSNDVNRADIDGKKGRFGIYAGVNLSKFINEPIPANAWRTGWQAGIYGRTGGTVFGQIGAEYRNSTSTLIRTGQGTTGSQVSNEIRDNIDQHFLAIPAYVGVRIGGLAGLRLQAGAELAALVAVGKNNFQLGADDLNRTILNGLAGAGINLGPLTLDANYNYGFARVFDKGADTKRRLWSFNVGFRF